MARNDGKTKREIDEKLIRGTASVDQTWEHVREAVADLMFAHGGEWLYATNRRCRDAASAAVDAGDADLAIIYTVASVGILRMLGETLEIERDRLEQSDSSSDGQQD